MADSSGTEDLRLRDGTTLRLRPLRPDDAERLLDLWQRTSEEARRQRFMGPFVLDASNVSDFVRIDQENEVALTAVSGHGDDERCIAVARYRRLPETKDVARVAVLVEDAHQGRGIGRALLRRLAKTAREAGIASLTGDYLSNNDAILRLLEDLGLRYESSAIGTDRLRTRFEVETTDRYLENLDQDEKTAAHAALERFFNPASVAVVGASRDPLSIGGLVFENLLRGGFQGAVYPVNRASDVVQSVRAYPNLAACPTLPEMIFICVPARFVFDVVSEACGLGVRAACIVSAGFAEASEEGIRRQELVLQRARADGMRIVGPNCMGLMNAAAGVRLNGSFSRIFPEPGRILFSSQSGALGMAVIEHLDRLGLGIGKFISVGNKADISGNDILLHAEDDPDIDVVLFYLESFGNPRKFSRIARRISRKKTIVAVKSGRTSAGARAASSHTGALAAGDSAVDALFAQAGIIRTDTLEELFDVATLLSTQPLPPGKRVAIVTNGGGLGILAADACESHGLEVPSFEAETRERLRAFLPPEAGVDNPVDMIASSTADDYGRALRVLGQAREIDAVIVIFIPPGYTHSDDVAQAVAEARALVPDEKPILSVFMNAKGIPRALAEARLPAYPFPEEAARALARVAAHAEWKRADEGQIIRPHGMARAEARQIVERAQAEALSRSQIEPSRRSFARVPGLRSAWLPVSDAIALLKAYGIPMVRSTVVDTAEAACRFQQELASAVVIKPAASIHKSDLGAVRLGLETRTEIEDAIDDMAKQLREHGLAEASEHWWVQEMMGDGVEILVGVTHDPSFGPLVVVGAGGTLVEVHKDIAMRITPLSDQDIKKMLKSLRIHPVLAGYRGRPGVDIPALESLIARVGALVEDIPEVLELDLNPVIAQRHGATAVDLRIKIRV